MTMSLSNDTALVRRLDLFNPNPMLMCSSITMQQQYQQEEQQQTRSVSHLSSNGYYGFAQIRNENNDLQESSIKAAEINLIRKDCEVNTSFVHNTTTTMHVDDCINDTMYVGQNGIDGGVGRHEENCDQSHNILSIPQQNLNCNENLMTNYRNCSMERRKRLLGEEQRHEGVMYNQNIKRFRSCGEEYLNENHGVFPSMMVFHANSTANNNISTFVNESIATELLPKATDQATLVKLPSSVPSFPESHDLQKSNFNNNKYIDISRCMSSHMI